MTSSADVAHAEGAVPVPLADLARRTDVATRTALRRTLDDLGPSSLLEPLEGAALQAASGGKRLRGTFAFIGAAIADGLPAGDAEVDPLAAALELYQASALAHDDLIDHSSTRRGRPTPHVLFATQHRAAGWWGSAEEYGVAGAVLVGDLLLSAADHTVARAARDLGHRRGCDLLGRFTLMHAEVALGQYLDVRAEQVPLDAEDPTAVRLADTLEVVRRKSARYSVVHPLALGVIAGGGDADLLAAVESVTGPWGTAFQLRDDDLGVFGEPGATGKPAGGDLLEGKRTPLLALTWKRADPAERRELAAGLGQSGVTAEQLARMVDIVGRRGRGAHEAMISGLVDEGGRALVDAGLEPRATALLAGLGDLLTRRRA
ncbi:polyprenyl synthetase family protein [Actinomyces polynesiensis]|uniref:polyprenyl synthetase family protein n=1 Tax=Actinomyces polynesiensis TaxID=1325934 RepID=UPI0006945518|nr:polyprenyl synthetase family protein [Actinomyces polynesiensis]